VREKGSADSKPFFFSVLLLGVALGVSAVGGRATQKAPLAVKSVPGTVACYQLQSSSSTTGQTTAPVANPEGGSKFTQHIQLIVLLKSLEPKLVPGGSPLPRFLATFEKAVRDDDSDSLDPSTSPFDPFTALTNRSVQFVLTPAGQVQDVEGLEEVTRDASLLQPVLQWLPQLSAATRLPLQTVSIGEKWKSEHSVSGMPFTDLMWRTNSTYLRNEPCKLYAPSGDAGAPASQTSGEECAIVLTQFAVSRRGSPSSEATPEEFLHNGLRTSGKWTGSGESLDSISVSRGILISSTQTSTQDVDFAIKSAASGSVIRRQGHTETHTEIVLLPDAPSPARSP
jgi:hypothetical protein